MKKLSIALLGLIVLLVVAVLVGPSFIDWNAQKGRITAEVERLTGRKLAIDGDLSLTILPAPAFSAARVLFANIEGGSAPSMIELESLDIRVALIPLIQGRVEVERVDLVRPTILVEILPDVVFAGEVTRITHEADLQKNTLQVKVRVLEPDPVLKPQMLCRVRFLAEGGEPGPGAAGPRLLVPAECVHRDEGTGEARVWVVRDRRGRRGRSMPVPVVVGDNNGEWVSVRGDLVPGDLLVVAGDAMSPGRPVRIRQTTADGGSS